MNVPPLVLVSGSQLFLWVDLVVFSWGRTWLVLVGTSDSHGQQPGLLCGAALLSDQRVAYKRFCEMRATCAVEHH